MLRVENVGHTYDGGEPILSGVSFRVDPGEKVVLLGANGTGKTTLLRILNGLVRPTRGRVCYANDELTTRALRDRDFRRRFRSEVVLLFQNPEAMIFNPTVYDEIAFGPRQLGLPDVEERVRRWAETFGLSRYLARPPFHLSSGEKQKLCLAALLVLEPRVLLLDEPTASLDPRSTGWLIDFLRGLDAAVLISTHSLSVASELGERILVLSERHELIYDGPVDGLCDNEEKLLEANLVHVHDHRHGRLEHRHYHTHDWD